MFGIALLIHILGATIWTGGHIVLAATVLPRALKSNSIDELSKFESGYERIGIPALIAQIVTGFWLAHRLVPDASLWFDFSDPVGRLIGIKIILLAVTAGLAADARLRIIPNLTEKNLVSLAYHIIPVTIVSILYVVVGVSFRTGWFY